ncbi:MAG: DUF3418 domain-containing protein, partial [Kiritimatiellae bacterium]|nr:DUF3418 domain-containing protein [Kiritimatiellia bacterium]
FHPQSRIQRLVTEQISQASSRQRRGRCGRTGPGICLRLYSEDDLSQAPEYTDPEIRRSSLAEVILRMAILGLPPLNEFPLIDPPKGAAISEGYRTLFDIGAMTKSRNLTKRGRLLASFSLEPRLARMLEEAKQEQVLPAVLVCAAYCSIQDPRERPADKTEAADQAHAAWKEPASDFLGILHMWNAICAASASRGKRNRFCRQHFLHPRRVEEWLNLVDDLRETCRKHRWEVPPSIGEMELLDSDGLHRSILAGIPRSIGEKEDNQLYRNPGGQQFRIFPGSALAKKPPSWVMTFTLLETSYLFARECAAINPDWVEEVAPHLCRYQYERPVWNAKRGFVEAEERVQLGQLTLRMGKRIHYGRIDPRASRSIFLQDALVPAKLQIQHPSFKHYQQLLASLDRWEHKLRRPGYFTGSQALTHHFEHILPATIFTRRDFETWCMETDWVPSLDDLFEGESVQESDYPDELRINGVRVGIEYSHDPEHPERDGITWVVNERDLSALPNELLEWAIPAWLPEKVEALIKSLDKKLRVRCMPITKTATEAIAWFHQQNFIYTHSLHQALASFLAAKLDCILAAPDLDPARLPGYLQSSLTVIDQEGNHVYTGTTFPGEQQMRKTKGAVKSSGSHPWMQTDCRDWPDPPFPPEIDVDGHTHSPALADEGNRTSGKLYSHRAEAAAATL